ncbi:MAG: galactokinase [Litorimonas sp.]
MTGAEALFAQRFGAQAEERHTSPGRVNLIGEHTDYNGGAVLPTALPLGIGIALSPRTDGQVRIVSDGFDAVAERALGDPAAGHWSDYALGAAQAAASRGWLGGADLALTSDLPMGSGLSSSAAIIVGVLKAARNLADDTLPDAELAMAARRVETDFIGVPCGIMDQMAIALAAPGQALFLDTHTLDRSLIGLPTDPVVAVLHSGVHRKLSDGRYRDRKEECDRAKAALGRPDLCRAELTDLERIGDDVARRRARHCITEHDRTVAAAQALRGGDWSGLGRLMTQSHASMRDDFDITTPGIDALVETAVAAGALGARMTGGGFGGCVVALVPAGRVDVWRSAVLATCPKAWSVL